MADFELPADVDLGEYAQPFEDAHELAAFIASDENDLYGTVAYLHNFAVTQWSLRLKDAYLYAERLMKEGVIRSGGYLEAVSLIADAVMVAHDLLTSTTAVAPSKPPTKPAARKGVDLSIGSLGWLDGSDGAGYGDDCYYGDIGGRS